MAYVSSGSWHGTPVNMAPGPRAAANYGNLSTRDAAAAFGTGYESEADRAARTGVDRGGQGYVSGQANPSGAFAAPTAPAPAGGTPRGTTQTPAPSPAPSTPSAFYGAAPALTNAIATKQAQAGRTPASDTTTQASALSSGAGTTSTTGTTQGQGAVPNKITYGEGSASISPTVNALNQVSPGLGDQADIGGKFLSPTQADLSPTINAQNAAFGLGGEFGEERYDYRPGAAASQGIVSLDKTEAEQTRARQQAALDALQGAANGTVPSAAELQMRAAAGRDVAATLGQARALGGRSAGGAARAGTLASADILNKNRVEGDQLRAAEQAQNRQAYQAALAGVRGQDIDTSSADARLRQEAYANNLKAQQEQNELAERHRQALIEAQLNAYGIGTQAAGSTVGASAKNAEADNKFKGGLLDTAGAFFL
jgi:hypothetical protein